MQCLSHFCDNEYLVLGYYSITPKQLLVYYAYRCHLHINNTSYSINILMKVNTYFQPVLDTDVCMVS